MNYQLITHENGAYVECLADGELLQSENDVLDLVGGCGEFETHRLLAPAEALPPAFYDLKTGLAGMILQKLVNYRITAAFVLDEEMVGNGRFYEMMIESNRGRQFHFSIDRQVAEQWLTAS